MLKTLFRDRLLTGLFVFAIALKLFSLNPGRVEKYYTYGIYPVISRTLRILFGWVPFSAGDIIYGVAFIFFVLKVWKLIHLLAKSKFKNYLSWVLFRKYIKLVLWIYVIFYFGWGLNYDRKGIASQLDLRVKPYTRTELTALAILLQERLCTYGDKVDSLHRLRLNKNKLLFNEGVSAYEKVEKRFSYLVYRNPSVKASLLTPFGHLFGFTGYYNPFTAEAQLKTSVPVFVKPFVVCHEIAHQLGYAKENEANFVGFLAARVSDDPEFVYSAYFDMYSYTLRELVFIDPAKAYVLRMTAHPQVRKDRKAYLQYLFNSKNSVEPFISGIYDNYLKLNNQPEGKYTYDEVVSWLIAYMNKYGKEAI
jgi:hypothetical protein